ncbi:MAG TPA: hypothetical protein ENF70_01985 [Deltaproteobacteria bacterium]|nr:hypothetical protein [Deltaproteobacteria bacterium]
MKITRMVNWIIRYKGSLFIGAGKRKGNRSRDYNARFTATHRTVSVHRALQMRGGGYADVPPVLQVPDNKADAVPCERLRKRAAIAALLF